MPLNSVTKHLYGGAITVDLPNDVLDASELRQIPDHQEVFLSNKALTSIIIEINEYQHPDTVSETNTPNTHDANPDHAAASFHLTDTIEPPDHFSSSGIQTSPIKLTHTSVAKYPAYTSIATIVTPEVDTTRKTILPLEWQTNPAQKEQLVGVLQLLVRLKEYEVDLCVRINVPLKEYGSGDATDDAAREETRVAREVLGRVVSSLDVKDFGLFGGD